jgi:hypothetical protein
MPISETFHEFPWHIPIKYMVQSITPILQDEFQMFCWGSPHFTTFLHWVTSHLDVASVSSTASKPWICCRFEPCWRGGATWWPNSNKYWGFRSQCCASYACSTRAQSEAAMARGERGPLSSAERMRSGGFLKRDFIEIWCHQNMSFCHFDHTRSLKIVGFLWSDGSCTGKKDHGQVDNDHGSSFEKTYESSTTSWKPYDDQPWDGWLVVWNMNFLIFHILGMSSSPLTKSYFSEG